MGRFRALAQSSRLDGKDSSGTQHGILAHAARLAGLPRETCIRHQGSRCDANRVVREDDHEPVATTRMATIERGNMEHNHVRIGIAAAVMAIVLIAVTVSGYA